MSQVELEYIYCVRHLQMRLEKARDVVYDVEDKVSKGHKRYNAKLIEV